MTLAELKTQLVQNPELPVRFYFPGGQPVPPHAHVTEVALIDKKFVDCGGTFRNQSMCRLQTWVSDDHHHRLKAGVLLKILEKGAGFFQSDDIEVDVEHELEYITQFPISSVAPAGREMIVQLARRHTDCLAKEKCCPPTPIHNVRNPNKGPLTPSFAEPTEGRPTLSPSPIGSGQADGEREKNAKTSVVVHKNDFNPMKLQFKATMT